MEVDEDKLREWIEYFKEAREIRRRCADWGFVRALNHPSAVDPKPAPSNRLEPQPLQDGTRY